MVRLILKTFGLGVVFGLGLSLVLGIGLYAYNANLLNRVISYVKPPANSAQALEVVLFEEKDTPANPYMNLNRNKQTPIPSGYSTHYINDTAEFWNALTTVIKNSGNSAIVFSDGIYNFNKTLNITVPNVMLLSKSGSPKTVILKGSGMQRSKKVNNLILVSASGFVLDGITLREAGNHLIQLAAEKNADIPVIRNCILQDGYEHLIKVSYNKNTPEIFSDTGLLEYCLFEYTLGIGPNYYIGGIDAHGIRNWTIRNNIFKNIASPSDRIAEHAIHIWNNTSNNLIEGNVIIDSDRGIGFGMRNGNRHPNIKYSNFGGAIKNNIIYHSENDDEFPDAGIILEDSPNTLIEDNVVFLEHNYRSAIEYRYLTTNNIVIKNNQTNKSISSRNGGQAKLVSNGENLEKVDILGKLKMRLNELGALEHLE